MTRDHGTLRLFVRCILLVSLGGCATMGGPAAHDPQQTLYRTEELFPPQGQPWLAERLLRDVLFGPPDRNPQQKLSWAEALFAQQGEPWAAERLLREAMAAYQQRNDQFGLAMAYRAYGLFFTSEGIKKWETFYRTYGFQDTTASYDHRLEHSVADFQTAGDLFASLKRYDGATDVWLHVGFTDELMGKTEAACRAFDKSLESARLQVTHHPTAHVKTPAGYQTYEEFIAASKQAAGCPH